MPPRLYWLLVVSVLISSTVVAQVPGAEVPQREQILCVCGIFPDDLFIAKADGSHQRAFVPGTDSKYNASFSSDGQWIVFTSERTGKAEIYRAHLDWSGLEHLIKSASYDDQGALSPDGRQVVVPDGTVLNLMDIDGTHARTLFDSKSRDQQILSASWSHDEGSIAFEIGDYDRGPRILSLPDGRITKPTSQWDNFPAWLPRGDRIAFMSLRSGDFEIYTTRLDSTRCSSSRTTNQWEDAPLLWLPAEFISNDR